VVIGVRRFRSGAWLVSAISMYLRSRVVSAPGEIGLHSAHGSGEGPGKSLSAGDCINGGGGCRGNLLLELDRHPNRRAKRTKGGRT